MAVDIYLDPLTGDIDLTNNSTMRLTANIEESSRQQTQIILGCFRGEWVFNINFGIPYIENDNNTIKALGGHSTEFLDALIREAILTRENIVEITDYTSSLDKLSGKMTVNVNFVTLSGEVVTVESLSV